MNKNLKLGLAITFFCCGSAAVVSAQDDSVQVDLSVLESLGNAPAVAAPAVSEPLFPIVKKAPAVKKTASRPAKRSSARADETVSRTAAVKETVPAAEPKVTVEVKETAVSAPAAPENRPALQQIPFVKDAEPVVVVDVEPAPAPKAVSGTKAQPSSGKTAEAESAAENPSSAVTLTVSPETTAAGRTAPAGSQSSAAGAAIPAQAGTNNQISAEKPQVPAQPIAAVEIQPASDNTAKPAPALLVDERAPRLPQPGGSAKLSFADGVDELNDEQKKQIDAIIASFEDASNNKIAIYSYNLDDGVDTFKKKRLSLNRAVEIRSYLLPRGYKNFSIKVINVDAASGKGNTVELEELK